jgi:hypothetical protein
VYAQNRKEAFHVVKEHWWIEIGSRTISLDADSSEILYPAEVGWAPDNSALFITGGGGYTTGTTIKVYRIGPNGIEILGDLNRAVMDDFDRRHKCEDKAAGVGNYPNVAGLMFMDNSNQILVVAEVPNLGICKDHQYFGGYLVSTSSGKIVERFSPKQLVDRWPDLLGWRLKEDWESLSPKRRATIP